MSNTEKRRPLTPNKSYEKPEDNFTVQHNFERISSALNDIDEDIHAFSKSLETQSITATSLVASEAFVNKAVIEMLEANQLNSDKQITTTLNATLVKSVKIETQEHQSDSLIAESIEASEVYLGHETPDLGWVEAQKILSSDGGQEDRFGKSVAMSEDWVIVGANFEGTEPTGAAYMFKREGESWREVQKIQASDKDFSDQFGRSVAMSGDWVIVGAEYEDTGATNAGAAYLFKRNGDNWTEVQKIQASDKEAKDYFGNSVAMSGDWVIVGSRYEDTGGASTGAAYLFKRNGDNWTEIQKIQASDKDFMNQFGNSVAMSGDWVIVGAHYENTGADSAGAAYLFKRNGDNWTEVQKIQASDREKSDLFGNSVAMSGSWVIVGAHYEDTGATNAGAAYLFKCNGDRWTEVQKIQASDKQEGDQFGFSVAMSGDWVIVGADDEDTGAITAGAVYLFKRNGDNWTEVQKIQASDKKSHDYFGNSIAMFGSWAIVGAASESTRGQHSGAAYLFKNNPGQQPIELSAKLADLQSQIDALKNNA